MERGIIVRRTLSRPELGQEARRAWQKCFDGAPARLYAPVLIARRTGFAPMNDSEHWMLDDLPIGVWVARAPEGNVVYVNRAFRDILGMEAVSGSVIGDVPATYRVHDGGGNPFPVEKLPFSRALATGERVVVDDMMIHRHDGIRVPLRA